MSAGKSPYSYYRYLASDATVPEHTDVKKPALAASSEAKGDGETKGNGETKGDWTDPSKRSIRGGPVSWLSLLLLILTGGGIIAYYDQEKKRHLEGRENLWCQVTEQEVISIIQEADMDKAPGPDGLGASFYQAHLLSIKDLLLQAICDFMRSGSFLKSFNATFLVLIPKEHGASRLDSFRPIACCNMVYKIFASVICNRMKPLMKDLISHNQSAFIPGRNISENCLLAGELLKDFNKRGQDKCCVKLDLRKAYDSINRDFLFHFMSCMGFSTSWIQRVKTLVTSPMFSVIVNGSAEGFFKSSRGLRQGDPMSPYLFTIIMEFFSNLMEIEVLKGNIRPLMRNVAPEVSHLLYADDLLVFLVPDYKGTKEAALSRMVLRACIWHAWKERNMRIFEKAYKNMRRVMQDVEADIQSLFAFCRQQIGYGERGKMICNSWRC